MKYLGKFANAQAEQAAIDDKQLQKPYVAYVVDGDYIDWNKKEETPDYASMYLTVEVLDDAEYNFGGNTRIYSINDGEWIENSHTPFKLNLQAGDKVRFKRAIGGLSMQGQTKRFKVYGNVMSLNYGDNFIGKINLTMRQPLVLKHSTGLVDVSNLILPAIEFSEAAAYRPYAEMFWGCSNITKAPVLPAAVIPTVGYQYMFYDCSSLNNVTCLATTIGKDTTDSWLKGVSATGTFVKHPNATWEIGPSGIPEGWTVVDADIDDIPPDEESPAE